MWSDGRFRSGLSVVVDAETGRIREVMGASAPGPRPDHADAAREPAGPPPNGGGPEVVPLPGRALVPGFVNAHSHAFQRLARGRTQSRPVGREAADFWSWREAMYDIALSLSADEVYDVSRFCFLEMLRTGITTVGEFHYLHHQPDGTPYADPNELAHQVIAAARDVGIRIALLNVCYATGGIGQPLEDRQRRFRASSLDAFLRRTADLREHAGGLVTVGVAPHSVRAVPRDWLAPLRDWAVENDAPIHMHVSERTAEVAASVAAYGLRPVELLAEDGLLDGRFTAVHATHIDDGEVGLLGGAGATVCACPTTERDLGDGFLRGLDLLEAGADIALGTDSHTALDFLAEMRLVEYHERLARLERVVITDRIGRRGRARRREAEGGGEGDGERHGQEGDRHRVAPRLLDMATAAGARSLGLEAGSIEAGRLADLVAIDLDHHSLAGWSPDTLDAMLTLSATPDVVRDVWVGGQRRLADRANGFEDDATAAFRRVAAAPRG